MGCGDVERRTGIVGGSSGSPVFAADDAERAVGIVNTTSIAAAPGVTCYLGQPCEVTADGPELRPDRTYAMPVGAWAACFDPGWDPDVEGCPAEDAPVAVDAPQRAVPGGATWQATIAGAGEQPLVKAGPMPATHCRDVAGYAASSTGTTFDDPLPTSEGFAVLCAAASDDRGRPVVDDAGFAVMVVDTTPPDAPIALSVDVGDDGARVEPIFAVPEYSSFDLKFGPAGVTDCADDEGYATYRRIPVSIPAADLPATVCVVGEDEAGNRGPPQSFAIS